MSYNAFYALHSIYVITKWKITMKSAENIFLAKYKHSINVSYYYNENLILDIIICSNPAGRLENAISKLRE